MQNNVREILENNETYKFYYESMYEKYRLKYFFKKEQGTISWLKSLTKDDILFDIGANIGLYSIYASPKVKRVFAFEPHLGNAYRLLQNIHLNDYNNVNLIASPIGDRAGLFDFEYSSLKIGKAFNSLKDTHGLAVEQKMSVHLDSLVEEGVIPAPTALKLDVDGREPIILRGMQNILASKTIKSMVVEYNPTADSTIENNEIRDILEGAGYSFIESQFTNKGESQIKRGKDPNRIEHNFLFKLK